MLWLEINLIVSSKQICFVPAASPALHQATPTIAVTTQINAQVAGAGFTYQFCIKNAI